MPYTSPLLRQNSDRPNNTFENLLKSSVSDDIDVDDVDDVDDESDNDLNMDNPSSTPPVVVTRQVVQPQQTQAVLPRPQNTNAHQKIAPKPPQLPATKKSSSIFPDFKLTKKEKKLIGYGANVILAFIIFRATSQLQDRNDKLHERLNKYQHAYTLKNGKNEVTVFVHDNHTDIINKWENANTNVTVKKYDSNQQQ